MSTNEPEDPQDEKDQRRERGGMSTDDRAKDFDGQSGPFDTPQRDEKRKE